MEAKDILLIDKWLWSKLNSNETPPVTPQTILSYAFGTKSSQSARKRNRDNLSHTRLMRYDGTELEGSSILIPEYAPLIEKLPPEKQLFLPGLGTIDKSLKIIDAYQFANDEVIVVP